METQPKMFHLSLVFLVTMLIEPHRLEDSKVDWQEHQKACGLSKAL